MNDQGSIRPPQVRAFAEVAGRIQAAARGPASLRVYGEQCTPDGAERYPLVLLRILASRPHSHQVRHTPDRSPVDAPARLGAPARRRRVLINGGTHGDEPAGTEAVLQFLEQRRYARWPDVDFTVIPCMNPWGYVYHRREGPSGVDLNRTFGRLASRTAASPEVAAVQRALACRRFDLFVDCHEDVDAPGFYVFAPTATGRAIAAAAGEHGPLHPGPLVDGELPVRHAVVALDPSGTERPAAPSALGAPWPLPSGSWAASLPPPNVGQVVSATLETPTRLPMAQRVAMHLAALDAALATL